MSHSACPFRRIKIADMPNRAYLVGFIPFLKPICHRAFQLPLNGKNHELARIMRLFKGLLEQNGFEGMKTSETADPF